MFTKSLFRMASLAVLVCCLTACSDDGDAYDPYSDWQARNADYFSRVAATARKAIAEAKATYGEQWEEHCDWRMFKTFHLPQNVPGALTDSVCVHIETPPGVRGKGCPAYSDSVRVSYRGTLMPAEYMENGVLRTKEVVFSQSFSGEFDPAVAVPSLMAVSSGVHGFATALQHMHAGDEWRVYIPASLGYGATQTGAIPAWSTLTFFIHLADYYTVGTPVPGWK